MNQYQFSYCENYKSLIWGVIADSRATIPAVKDQIGDVIKAYVDSQTALVVPGVIPYKIELDGSLVGYFGLQTGSGAASVLFFQLRPAFQNDILAINQQISSFIQSSNYIFDTL